jgi:hypothetical protein
MHCIIRKGGLGKFLGRLETLAGLPCIASLSLSHTHTHFFFFFFSLSLSLSLSIGRLETGEPLTPEAISLSALKLLVYEALKLLV